MGGRPYKIERDEILELADRRKNTRELVMPDRHQAFKLKIDAISRDALIAHLKLALKDLESEHPRLDFSHTHECHLDTKEASIRGKIGHDTSYLFKR